MADYVSDRAYKGSIDAVVSLRGEAGAKEVEGVGC